MMGRREGGQGQFFYSFDLDRVVPPDHLVRQIDSVLDLSWVHGSGGSNHFQNVHVPSDVCLSSVHFRTSEKIASNHLNVLEFKKAKKHLLGQDTALR